MKITTQHYNALKVLFIVVDPLQKHGITKLTDVYMRGKDDGSIQAKDINKRLRWDLFHCINNSSRVFLLDELYTYMNDDHIDTALKHIMDELYDEEFKRLWAEDGADTPMESIEVEITSITVNK